MQYTQLKLKVFSAKNTKLINLPDHAFVNEDGEKKKANHTNF